MRVESACWCPPARPRRLLLPSSRRARGSVDEAHQVPTNVWNRPSCKELGLALSRQPPMSWRQPHLRNVPVTLCTRTGSPNPRPIPTWNPKVEESATHNAKSLNTPHEHTDKLPKCHPSDPQAALHKQKPFAQGLHVDKSPQSTKMACIQTRTH